jgi:hypothetical protein
LETAGANVTWHLKLKFELAVSPPLTTCELHCRCRGPSPSANGEEIRGFGSGPIQVPLDRFTIDAINRRAALVTGSMDDGVAPIPDGRDQHQIIRCFVHISHAETCCTDAARRLLDSSTCLPTMDDVYLCEEIFWILPPQYDSLLLSPLNPVALKQLNSFSKHTFSLS